MNSITSKITINDISIEVIQKKIRTIRLTISPPDGHVRISAPHRIGLETIGNFAASKMDWIRKHQTRIRSLPWKAPLQYISGEEHYYLGNSFRLEVIVRNGRAEIVFSDKDNHGKNISESSFRSRYKEDGQVAGLGMTNTKKTGYCKQDSGLKMNEMRDTGCWFTMCVRPKTGRKRRQAILDEWYRNQLKEIIPSIIGEYEEKIGVHAEEWGIKKMKTKWGTCNIRAKRIWLNLELAQKPLHFIEHVIVHELVHLLERKHNARFKNLMKLYLPKNNEELSIDNR